MRWAICLLSFEVEVCLFQGEKWRLRLGLGLRLKGKGKVRVESRKERDVSREMKESRESRVKSEEWVVWV